MRLHKTYELSSFKALPDQGGDTGRFEAIVSVFGNVDYQGDRVMPGAFEKSIKNLQERGDPLPVIWSHEWGDPFAHIGYIDPSNMEETQPSKAGLPGGLLVRGQLDVHKPFAKQVYDLLAERRVKEWSFAYDVVKERKAEDSANELQVLDLIEVGPTLKGANDQTVTLGVKSQLEKAAKIETDATVLAMAMDIDPDLAKALMRKEDATGAVDGMREHLVAEHGKDEEDVASLDMDALEKMHNAIDHETASHEAGKALNKNVYQALDGSWEYIEQKLQQAVQAWADTQFPPDAEGDRPYVCSVGTFADRVDVAVEFIDQETQYFEFPYQVNADGEVVLGDAASVDVEVTVVKAYESDGEKAIDDGAWDGAAAMGSCSNASDFGKIAFRRTGDSDPDTAAAWALPHHSSPGAGPNVKGVGSAIGALNGARGGAPDLRDPGAARSHLEAHQTEIQNAQKTLADAVNAVLDEVGTKAGRVIGSKRVADLKASISSSIDEWATAVNGDLADGADTTKADDTINPDTDTEIARIKARLDELTEGM